MSAVKKYATDETFREVADLLFGAGGSELIAKANPDGADVSTSAQRKKLERRQAQVGLASNVVGIGAGVAGLKDAGVNYKKVRKIPTGGVLRETRKIKGSTKAWAAGAVGLQAANLAGDAVANRVLARSAKGDKKKVSKGYISKAEGRSLTATVKESAGPPSKGKLTRAAVTGAGRASGAGEKYGKGYFKQISGKLNGQKVKKNAELDVVWEGEFSKVNADKQQVFGWASIVEMNGEKVVDLQGDYISIDEVEKSGYEYVMKSRKGGDMHLRDGFDKPVHASEMIESFIVTPEKKQALNLPEETPVGWWVGYQVNDPEVWAKVKSGERTGFSIHGRGQRSEM